MIKNSNGAGNRAVHQEEVPLDQLHQPAAPKTLTRDCPAMVLTVISK
jgi:hypothetical protein